MVDIKNLVVSLFPAGEFVTFDEVRMGDTIIRGGCGVSDEAMVDLVSIMRASVFDECTPDEKLVAWVSGDKGWVEGVVAFRKPDTFLNTPWFYRVDVSDGLLPSDKTTYAWVECLLKEMLAKDLFVSADFDDLVSGQTVLVIPERFPSGREKGDFFTEIHLGVIGDADDDRDGFYSNIPDSSFVLVVKPSDLFPYSFWVVK